MAVEEGSPPNILTGNADSVPLLQQGPVSEIFAHPPINEHLAPPHSATIVDDLLHSRMQCEFLGNGGNRLCHALKLSHGHSSVGFFGVRDAYVGSPIKAELASMTGQSGIEQQLTPVKMCSVILDEQIRIFS